MKDDNIPPHQTMKLRTHSGHVSGQSLSCPELSGQRAKPESNGQGSALPAKHRRPRPNPRPTPTAPGKEPWQYLLAIR
jgi:hypothetical protein